MTQWRPQECLEIFDAMNGKHASEVDQEREIRNKTSDQRKPPLEWIQAHRVEAAKPKRKSLFVHTVIR